MKFSLRTKLTATYLFVTLVCVALISISTNFLLNKQFQQYVKQNQELRNEEIVKSITNSVSDNGRLNKDKVENIGIIALENNLIVKVKDINGNIIWDATVHNHGQCERIIQQTAKNMKSVYPNINGGFSEKSYSITYNNKKIGTVNVGSYGPFYYSLNDIIFISTLNKIFFGIGLFSLLLAFIIGTYMAKRLIKPISRVIASAQMISKGYYEDRISDKSNTKEIHELMETINDLASELSAQESLRRRLTSDMAHEIRTPLTTLQGHLEAIIDGIWEMEPHRLEGCHEEVLRINRMVSDLEQLAKFESENLILNKEKFDISALIKRIILNFENDFSSKNIKVSFKGQPQYVSGDKDKISQVIVNLISNSIKYTNENGNVWISISEEEGKANVSIKDNGIGISEQDLPYVFERFYRADKSRNAKTGGTGIGLAIVKSIVEAHQGKIDVKSELGKGTEFTLYLINTNE